MNTRPQGVSIGVTGTRFGMTADQKRVFRIALHGTGAAVLHHGDCVGADADAHEIARELGLWIVGHPPTAEGLRAFTTCDELRPARPFMARNREIVRASDRLIGIPDGVERLRSGTWATIRIAQRADVPATVIYPDGRIDVRRWTQP